MNKITRNSVGESIAKSVLRYRDIFTRGCLLMKVFSSSSMVSYVALNSLKFYSEVV